MGLPQSGETFDNYKVIEVLGEGGMGQVLLAEDIKLSRKVALKFLDVGHKKMDEKTLQRFENEAKILASLNHPNIVNIYTFGTHQEMNYLAMEYVPGMTLSIVIQKKSFGVNDSIKAIEQVLQGLAEAHSKGILHRDIKPANLIVTEDKKIKIVDFGISKNLVEDDPQLTQENHFIGTINYMAPELLKGHHPTPASDLFSVGVVFYELLTGKNPFPTGNKIQTIDAIRNDQVVIPADVKKNIPPSLGMVIQRLITKDKTKRFQSANEALEALANIDESDMPDFHGISLKTEMVIENLDQVRSHILAKGYDETEAAIIIKLAAKMEELKQVAAQAPDDDRTVDLSLNKEDPLLNISIKNVDAAIHDYENSQANNTHNFTRVQPITPKRKKTQVVPFPLYKPKFALKSIFVIGLLAVNYWIYKQIFPQGNETTKELITSIKESLPGDAGAIFKEKLDDAENKIKRNLSSVPSGDLKAWDIGHTYQFKVRKINTQTGAVVYDHIDKLKVKKLVDGTMHAFLKDGSDGKWSSQHLALNAFVPPKRWYRKRGFNIKNVVLGDADSIYPVQLGKETTFRYRTLSKGGSYLETAKTCQVKDTENIQVGSKDIATFKITCAEKGEKLEATSILHYSPEMNMVIRSTRQVKQDGDSFEETTELISKN